MKPGRAASVGKEMRGLMCSPSAAPDIGARSPAAGLVLGMLLAGLCPGSLAAPDRFEARRDYPVPSHTYGATLADLDGDGWEDLVNVSYTPNLQIRFNNRDGSFGDPVSYTVGCGDARDVVAADFDRDDDLDLALTCRGSNRFTILWNDGQGGFPDYIHYMYVGEEPESIAAADLDGDQAPDVAFALRMEDSVAVYVNDGEGNLSFHGKYYSGGHEPQDVCAALLNGDAYPDLVVAHRYGGNIAIFMNRADGTFDPPVLYPIEQAPLGVAAGDVDGDGIQDLVAVNANPGFDPTENSGIALLRGFPDGTFGPAEYTYFGAASIDVELGDLDLDGDLDAAVAEGPWELGYAQEWYFLENDGTGSFTPHDPYPTSDAPWRVLVSDIAGGNEPEVVLVCCGGPTISSFHNLGDGQFRDAETLLSDVDTPDCASGDLDGDGDRDLVVTIRGGYQVGVFSNDGSGSFSDIDFYPAGGLPRAVQIEDYDGDQDLDLAVGLASSQIAIFLNDGSGAFSSPETYYAGVSPSWFVPSDLDKDGDKDLVAPSFDSMYLTVLWNDGLGGFADWKRLYVGDYGWNVTVDDFDGNDWPDIAVLGATGGTQEVWIFFNDGAGAFLDPVKLAVEDGDGLKSIASGNFDEDGLPDIAVADWYMYLRVHILWNEGGGVFAEGEPLVSGRYPCLIEAEDVDDDGVDDLLVGYEINYHDIGLFRSAGNRSFKPGEFYGCPMDPLGFDLADLDDDGDEDLTVATERGTSILWGRTHEITAIGASRRAAGLIQSWPNPFQGSTRLTFSLESPAPVEIGVLDVTGRSVWKLMAGVKSPGLHRFSWDGRDESGQAVASGVYFLWARIGGRAEVRRVVRIR
ncbi:MAG: hypothetical protein GF355_03205 [Candidatus Eisenbacteria bacterium]|nr:hypothetical protein [Candidatus Eisenbacteria bacterium]